LDRAEAELLDRTEVHLVKWSEGKPQSDIRVGLDTLRQSVAEAYLHLDIDSMDPKFAPGVTFDPVPGGISLAEMEDAIGGVFDRFRVRAAALTMYDPDRDQDDRTLKTGLRLIELVAHRATAQPS